MRLRTRFLAILILLPIVFLDMACLRMLRLDARLEDGVDISYLEHGRHRKTKALRELIARLPGLRQKSLQRVAERTGLRPLRPDLLTVFLLDDRPNSCATRAEVNGQFHHVAILNAEIMLSNLMNPAQVLTHEMTHTVMMQVAGPLFRRIPKWFIEGSAVWVAEEPRIKGKGNLLETLFSNSRLDRLCDGIDNPMHKPADYFESGLAFEWLEKRNGLEAVQRVIASVMKGRRAAKAFAHESGLPWSEVRRELHKHSMAFTEALMEEGGYHVLHSTQDAYLMCMKRVAGCAPTLRDLKDFLKERPDSFLAPVAWYRIGKIHRLAGRLEEAIHAFEIALRLQPSFGLRLNYWLGRYNMEAKHYERARACFEAVLINKNRLPAWINSKMLTQLCRIYQILDIRGQESKACPAAQ